MKTKTKKKPAAAPSPRFNVTVSRDFAMFFRAKEKQPYSVLGYGAPGSDARDKAEKAIAALTQAYPGEVKIRRV